MPASDRPLRTIKALAKEFGPKWSTLTNLEVGNGVVKVSFGAAQEGAQGVPVTAQRLIPPVSLQDKPIAEMGISDADLVLEPPAGMLVPVPAQEEPN